MIAATRATDIEPRDEGHGWYELRVQSKDP